MDKITIKVPLSSTKEVELSLPFYRKNGSTNSSLAHYFAAINEHTLISVFTGPNHISITSTDRDIVKDWEISQKFQEWETIDEEEFLEAHQKALFNLSLIPKITESTDDIPKPLFSSLPSEGHILGRDIKQ